MRDTIRTVDDELADLASRGVALRTDLRRALVYLSNYVTATLEAFDDHPRDPEIPLRVVRMSRLAETVNRAADLVDEINRVAETIHTLTTFKPQLVSGPTDAQKDNAIRLVLALHDEPESNAPGYLVRLDPQAEEQLRAAVSKEEA